MNGSMIQLTSAMNISSSSHILYCYDDLSSYVENAVSFIISGLEQGQHIIFAEQLSKLFKKYEKMNDDKSGQGIGLFMVKKLIDHFDGEIVITSVLDHGTEVTVRLPLETALIGEVAVSVLP